MDGRIPLSHTDNLKRFETAMATCRQYFDECSTYEREFINGLTDKWEDRKKFNSNWSPTVKQWNFLMTLALSLK